MNPRQSPPARTPTAIDAVAEAYFRCVLELTPELATSLGVPGHESRYSDHSPAGTLERATAMRTALAALDGLEPVDAVDAITLDAMGERLGMELEFLATGITELNNIECPLQGIRGIFDLMPTETAEDWEHIADRLANVDMAIGGYIQSLRTSRGLGHVAAARQVRSAIGQSLDYARDGGFFDALAAGARIDGAAPTAPLRERLATGAAAAARSYRGLARFLDVELLPVAPSKDAVGREYYELCSRRFLGAGVDLDEAYAWGVGELERIIAEQELVAGRILPGASIAEAKALLNADPARRLKGTDALRDWMQEKSDRAIADLADTHFEIPEPMRRLECMIAPTREGVVYYSVPSDDFSRPGRMWWSVPAGEDEFTTWAETSTVYHEGVPGHHLQYGTATHLRGSLNGWRRHACWVSGHGEGWALYAERLMLELGYLDDPGDHLGMLDMQRMRAARVVFDIGMHLELPMPAGWGGGAWEPERGRDFLASHLDTTPGLLEFEFVRYLGWPGQAPSYKIGQRQWEQIRDACRAAEGPAFDLKAFHTRALGIGSVGLDTLRRALLPPS
ncbi:DUF885 domain-containing protein [Paeniglutamicibacter cryotolerans]|uniref:Uncharacterized protein (DUF885 family) n=1 Tax=Paeniglutamicibacter cryotolerans TaxID=670079 RepID=A0A839QU89_9MICC|nr:DUF885 domain-containing protein [Paeniglutamicibacter cryotolerans]MBB2996832.1 uncharacterized protein (DUF885 family) [Paeniglutamicibacter cryotolerans]